MDSDRAATRVLVVDDSRLMRVAARRILAKHYDVVEAESGQAAWDLLHMDPRVRVTVSDLSMPELDGLGLLQRLRQCDQPRLRNMPVIIVTGAEDDDVQTKKAVFAAGASDFIHKPFDPLHLLARVQAQTQLSHTADALREQQDTLREQAAVDPLTGLATERRFHTLGQQQLAYAIRHRTELAVVRVRLDGLDGAPADVLQSLLKRAAGVLKSRLRREDTAAFMGETAFALLLPAANPVGARRLAERLCADMEQIETAGAGQSALALRAQAGVAAPIIQAGMHFEALFAAAAPSAHTPAPAAEPPAPPPDLETALALIEQGNTDRLRPHLDELVRRTFPLLDLWSRTTSRPLGDLLQHMASPRNG
ncbi:MAG: response regulator [Gammaproteobacteria bacterium]